MPSLLLQVSAGTLRTTLPFVVFLFVSKQIPRKREGHTTVEQGIRRKVSGAS